MVCAAVAQTINIDEDLKTAIAAALPQDPDIGPYLAQLRDPNLSRDEDTQCHESRVGALAHPQSCSRSILSSRALAGVPRTAEALSHPENSIRNCYHYCHHHHHHHCHCHCHCHKYSRLLLSSSYLQKTTEWVFQIRGYDYVSFFALR